MIIKAPNGVVVFECLITLRMSNKRKYAQLKKPVLKVLLFGCIPSKSYRQIVYLVVFNTFVAIFCRCEQIF